MYLVVIGWMYIAVMMAIAEATHANGSVLGAIVTFFLYGLLPVALMVYLMGTPLRRKARKAKEAKEMAAAQSPAPPDSTATDATAANSAAPYAGGHAPGAAMDAGIAAVRKES